MSKEEYFEKDGAQYVRFTEYCQGESEKIISVVERKLSKGDKVATEAKPKALAKKKATKKKGLFK